MTNPLTLADALALVDEYLGTHAVAQSGCDFFIVDCGGYDLKLEYEFDPGEDACYDVESPGVGPGSEAGVSILGALVNGRWIDVDGVFAPELIERWQQQILDSEIEVASDQREDYERDRYDDARDFAVAA